MRRTIASIIKRSGFITSLLVLTASAIFVISMPTDAYSAGGGICIYAGEEYSIGACPFYQGLRICIKCGYDDEGEARWFDNNSCWSCCPDCPILQ